MERIETLQAELDTLRHKDSTVAQQIEQFQQAVVRGKEELGKIRLAHFEDTKYC